MLTLFISIKIITVILAFLNGLICLTNPHLAIKLQQRFYERINWKIEPINLAKELRNTRIMGLISLVLAIALTILILK